MKKSEKVISFSDAKTEYEAPRLMDHIINLSYAYEFVKDMVAAVEKFWDNRPLELQHEKDIDEITFFSWFIFDYKLKQHENMTLLELYRKQEMISPFDQRILQSWQDSVIDFYEVTEILPDQGIRVKELFGGEEKYIKDKNMSERLRKNEIVMARLFQIEETCYIIATAIRFFPSEKTLVEDFAKGKLRYARKKNPDITMRQVLKEQSFAFFRFTEENIDRNKSMFYELNGENFNSYQSVYEIVDKKQLLKKMEELSLFFRKNDGDHYFLKEEDGKKLEVYGQVLLKDTRLTLYTSRRQDFIKAKMLFDLYFQKDTTHLLDTFQDEEAFLKEMDNDKDSLDYFRNYMRAWVFRPLKILHDKTPISAPKTEKNKRIIKQLLYEWEYIKEQLPQKLKEEMALEENIYSKLKGSLG